MIDIHLMKNVSVNKKMNKKKTPNKQTKKMKQSEAKFIILISDRFQKEDKIQQKFKINFRKNSFKYMTPQWEFDLFSII